MMLIAANIVDLKNREIYPVEITIEGGKIQAIKKLDRVAKDAGYILPGFVDAHVHIESSMLPPAEFARLAVVHGTLATVSDPHEIANVLGVAGVHYMLDEAKKVPFKFCFGAPSCVPATTFETAGANMDAQAVHELLQHPEIAYLSEVMNFPGVLQHDTEMMAKLASAKQLSKPIDGHAPGLRGAAAQQYFANGITTDHECFSYEEGREKALLGVNILIREGSAARNFDALWPLIKEFPQQIMFCSDDKHPDDLIKGHINQLVSKAVALGCDLFDVLYAACIHPVEHYDLPLGQLQIGDAADFIIVEDLEQFKVTAAYLDGQCVAQGARSLIIRQQSDTPNNFRSSIKTPNEFILKYPNQHAKIRVIHALDGEIVTRQFQANLNTHHGALVPDVEQDILKIVVVNRYLEKAPIAIGFVHGFGLKKGALASSVAHDSHNIVAIGTDDDALCTAVNAIIRSKGGISATDGQKTEVIPLPIAGLMSTQDGHELAEAYAKMDSWTKSALSCQLKAPFMVLSFLALPVIPELKMTDLGLFDVNDFGFVSVAVDR